MPVSPTPAGLTVFLSCRHGSHLAIEPALLTSYNVGQCDLYLHCQLVKLSQHLDSSIYEVKHQEHNSYTEREREPVCQAVKAPKILLLSGIGHL
jgi:hypothetical protein